MLWEARSRSASERQESVERELLSEREEESEC